MPPAASLGRPALVDRIREIIARQGPITFDRFMELALYDPVEGYYRRRIPRASLADDPAADYQTSPQVHPAFGHLVAAELVRVWEALDRPRPFVIVEPGAGDGELARQILTGLRDRESRVEVEYHAADARRSIAPGEGPGGYPGEGPTPVLSESARSRLVAWSDLAALSDAGLRAHCVVSNEFFDALPVHRLAMLDGKLREIYVDWAAAGFVERAGDVSDPSLVDLATRRGKPPAEGWRGEVCSRLNRTLGQIAALVNRGVVLTIDYGYGAGDRKDDSPVDETLVSYHRHQWNADVYRRVGEQDLTSHVDFGALVRLGIEYGFALAGALTQRELLLRHGLAAETERWAAKEATPGRGWQTRFAVAELVRLDGLGGLQVVAQQKGVPGYALE